MPVMIDIDSRWYRNERKMIDFDINVDIVMIIDDDDDDDDDDVFPCISAFFWKDASFSIKKKTSPEISVRLSCRFGPLKVVSSGELCLVS